jgi:hypothetical protein
MIEKRIFLQSTYEKSRQLLNIKKKGKPAYLLRAHFLLHRFQLASVTSGVLITGYKMVIITMCMRVTASPLHSCVAQGLEGQTHIRDITGNLLYMLFEMIQKQ